MEENLHRATLCAPVNVTWEVTTACNLRCKHCLSSSGEADQNELSLRECTQLIDQLSDLEVFQINFGGGEPFLRSDFMDILKHCQDKGLVSCVSTNGTVLKGELAKRLSKFEMLYLQVSLDGATAEVNDSIRGEGTFAQVIEGLDALKRNGVKYSINSVLTRLNFSQLEELRRIAEYYGAKLRISRFRPAGRGKDNFKALGPEKEQLEWTVRWLLMEREVRTGDSFFSLLSEKRRSMGLDMCGAAKMTCCVSPAGDVYPCAFLQEDPFLAGNVRNDCFSDLWRFSEVFTTFRSIDVTSCKNCSRFDDCRGGCPAMAYHAFQDVSRGDPQCIIRLGISLEEPENKVEFGQMGGIRLLKIPY